MDIDRRFEVGAPIERVWNLLRDPYVVAACFPGAELTEQVDAETYAGRITVNFGPTKVVFAGVAKIVVDDERQVGDIEARGRDGRGASSASAKARIEVSGAGESSVVEVTGTIDIGGLLGGFAASGGARITEVLLQEFGQAVTARATAADTGPHRASTDRTPVSVSISGVGVLLRTLLASLKRLGHRMAGNRRDARDETWRGE